MWQNYLIAAFIGWCGTGWPIHIRGGGGGGGGEPGDIGPPGCLVCNQIVGAISAIILVAILQPTFASSGLLGLATISFFGGSFGANLVGSLRGMASKG